MTKMNPIMTMITPGRRAYGEKWSKVTVTPTPEGKYDVEREDTPAPAGLRPIFVPALGNISLEMADFILEHQRKEQEYQVAEGRFDHSFDAEAKIQQLWLDYVEWKKRMLEGQTVTGPGGMNQRESIRRS